MQLFHLLHVCFIIDIYIVPVFFFSNERMRFSPTFFVCTTCIVHSTLSLLSNFDILVKVIYMIMECSTLKCLTPTIVTPSKSFRLILFECNTQCCKYRSVSKYLSLFFQSFGCIVNIFVHCKLVITQFAS